MRLEYFQLVDRIVALDLDGGTVKTHAKVPPANTIFEGHFPGHPLMPGVLLIEAMAQTSGWLIIALTKFERVAILAAVKEAKLRSYVTPGQDLAISAQLVHAGSGFTMTRAAIEANGKIVAESSLTLRQVPFPHPRFRKGMELVAANIGFPGYGDGAAVPVTAA